MAFDFNFRDVITLALGAVIPIAIYYVHSSVAISAASNKDEAEKRLEELGGKLFDRIEAVNKEAEKRLDDLGEKLFKRIDAIAEGVATLNLTAARSDERISQATRDIEKLEKRIGALEEKVESRVSAMEKRCLACETELISIQRAPKAAAT